MAKIIKTTKEYKEVLGKIAKLMDKDPEVDSKEGKKLDKLTDQVAIYEFEQFNDLKLSFLEDLWYSFLGKVRWIRNIPREMKWFFQRGLRGWSDYDVWDLDSYLNDWVPKAVKHLKSISHSHPVNLTPEEWDKILMKIAEGFEANQKWKELDFKNITEAKKLEATFKRGMKLFTKYYNDLWD